MYCVDGIILQQNNVVGDFSSNKTIQIQYRPIINSTMPFDLDVFSLCQASYSFLSDQSVKVV